MLSIYGRLYIQQSRHSVFNCFSTNGSLHCSNKPMTGIIIQCTNNSNMWKIKQKLSSKFSFQISFFVICSVQNGHQWITDSIFYLSLHLVQIPQYFRIFAFNWIQLQQSAFPAFAHQQSCNCHLSLYKAKRTSSKDINQHSDTRFGHLSHYSCTYTWQNVGCHQQALQCYLHIISNTICAGKSMVTCFSCCGGSLAKFSAVMNN